MQVKGTEPSYSAWKAYPAQGRAWRHDLMEDWFFRLQRPPLERLPPARVE
jgi:hypothetical protein